MGKRKAAAEAPSHLAQWLLEQIAWGHLSASQGQKIAYMVTKDVPDAHPAIQKFARIGTSGSNPANTWRDLQRWVGEPQFPLRQVELPLQFGVKKVKQSDVSILWPHEMFAALYTRYRDAWASYINPDAAAAFWNTMGSTELFRAHPLSTDPRDRSKCGSLAYM